jgi:class 3 adenylate cyclase/predicted ATPase
VHCTSCNSEAPEGKSFCANCGKPLERVCAACGARSAHDARFCSDCGVSLTDSGTQTTTSGEAHDSHVRAAPSEAAGSERRHLTVLFCDIVDSTATAASLDPEDWQNLVAEYRNVVGEAVKLFGGTIVRYLGDGVLVFFGYPEAHEDDAERAVRASLALLQAMELLNQRLKGEGRSQLPVRIGIDAGFVVVSHGGGEGPDVFGDTPNIAARVQAEAGSNTVLITDAVNKLVSGLFVIQSRGARQLKGIPEPVRLYRVVQVSGVRQRVNAAARGRGLTPFIGREEELRILQTRWDRARRGSGQVVLVVGEAGIGKSRLIQKVHDLIGDVPHTWIECGGAPFYQNTPFFAVSDMLQQGFAWRGDEPSEERITQIERSLELSGIKLADSVPLIASLLDLPLPNKYSPLVASSEDQHNRLINTLAQWLFGLARVQPAVLVVEDLHWADTSTLEMLKVIVDQAGALPIFFIASARMEFRIPWKIRAHHTQINLSPLNDVEIRDLVAQVASRSALERKVVDAVVEKTGGVPLFVEEMVRSLLEGGARVTDIPASLQDSLMGRLDRLGGAKEVAQVGATIGRDFSYQLIRSVTGISDIELQSHLERLVDADIVYQRGLPPDSTYTFKHALIRDSAYEALLKTQRKQLHGKIASVLEREFGQLAQTEPEVLAIHHSAAGDADRSSASWQAAGERAVIRGAFPEAKEYYNRALAELTHLAESPERSHREMLLWTGLGHVSTFLFGYASPETLEAYAKARSLGEKIGNTMNLLFVLVGLHISSLTRGEKGLGLTLANELLTLATRDGGLLAIVWANTAQTMSRFYLGDFQRARDHAAIAYSHYRCEDHLFAPQDPGVTALAHQSWASWHLGEINLARDQMREVLNIVKRLNRPNDLAFAEHFAGVLSVYLRDPIGLKIHATVLASLVAGQNFPFFSASSEILNGWVMLNEGRTPEGLAVVRKGVSDYFASGTRIGGFFLGMLAEAEAEAGLQDEALATIGEALVSTAEEAAWQPYLLWVKGKLQVEKAKLLPSESNGQTSVRAEHLEGAEQSFRDAIASAARIGAKPIQLRAATGLATLLVSRASNQEARDLVESLYASFSEGHDTLDLIEARQLLNQLR